MQKSRWVSEKNDVLEKGRPFELPPFLFNREVGLGSLFLVHGGIPESSFEQDIDLEHYEVSTSGMISYRRCCKGAYTWPSPAEQESAPLPARDVLSSIAGILQQRFAEGARILNLENRVSVLERRLEEALASIVVPVLTFAPEPYELRRSLEVVVHPTNDGFVASFFDASIHASGETREGAVENVKSLMLDIYDDLLASQPSELGPGPKRQLAILKAFIEKTT